MQTPKHPAWLSLLLLPAFAVSANSEIGIKSGYQIYSNDLGSPSTLGAGIFMNSHLSHAWSMEGSALFLGEAQENNANIGAFNLAELSARYNWSLLHDQQLFFKAGAAPWFGYMTVPNGGQGYEYGVSPIVGAGYRFPLYDQFYGRLEYQFIPNLGGDTIGHTDSHFLSFGLSWQTDDSAPRQDATAYTAAPSAVESQEPALTNETSGAAKSTARVATIATSATDHVERELYGSWLFDNDAAALVVPKPFAVLDKARQLVTQGCRISGIDVEGYADGLGTDEYNQRLSERRANKVATYLSHALSNHDGISVDGFGYERLSGRADVSFYERRVDFRISFQCEA